MLSILTNFILNNIRVIFVTLFSYKNLFFYLFYQKLQSIYNGFFSKLSSVIIYDIKLRLSYYASR
ncbi:hypothetical protein M947_00385 [Sulfurimonas hongkongensis]|uniref:Uncharacterized protein n=1 Tax=Sulfurimonas hongkongensis TaxID=1172190 RepID=T0JTK6_9BACT|nr:hypothetical protein M947_00385 [Sulfurimonas hongkongensis]